MNKYKYKFSKLATVLFILGFLVAIAMLVLNIIKLFSNTLGTVDKVPSYIFAIVIALAFIIFGAITLFCSYYYFSDKGIVIKLGFFKSTLPFSEMSNISHLGQSKKLVINYKNNEFSLIVIREELFDKFIDELKQHSPNLPFTSFGDK